MKFSLVVFLVIFSISLVAQNVGIGTETPDASAVLDVSSTDKGLLIPRGDTSNVSAPAVGLLFYQLSNNGFYSFNGSKWVLIGTVSDKIQDVDQDTRIEVEESVDEDKIRFYAGGTEVLRQNGATLEMPNSGKSVFIGEEAGLNDDLVDNNNVFVGFRAGKENTTGVNNVAIGEQALQNSTAGNNNVAIGKQALSLNAGNNNVGIGLNALQKNSTGQKNTGVGIFSGFTNQTGIENTFVGYEAGRVTATDISGSVMIGHQAGMNETESNKLYIANTSTATPLVYGDFSSNTLQVNDTLAVSAQLSVGNPVTSQVESAEVEGAIQIGNAATNSPAANDAGTVRWNAAANDYQGWDGTQWLSMTNLNEEIDCQIGTEIDTLPFVITEPGFYYLTKNLLIAVGGQTGIDISVNDVTIDLNGFTIEGPANSPTTTENAIVTTGARTSVINGNITNWGFIGIQCGGNPTNHYFYNLTITSCALGLFNTENSVIDHCRFENNTDAGLNIGSHNILNSCIASNNGEDGFRFFNSNKLINCIANDNGADGINGNDNNRIENCVADGNDGHGITADDYNVINKCTITESQLDGFHIDNFNTIQNNSVSLSNLATGSTGAGFRLVAYNKISSNIATENFGTGFSILSVGNILTDNHAFGTALFNNSDTKAFRFVSTVNAWRDNTISGTQGGTGNNVSSIQPPASRSLNNWLY